MHEKELILITEERNRLHSELEDTKVYYYRLLYVTMVTVE